MRPIFIPFFVVISLLASCGAAAKKPTDKAMICGREAIKVADSVLRKEIDSSAAADKLDNLSVDMNYVEYLSEKDKLDNPDLEIDVLIAELSIAVSAVTQDVENNKDILAIRNEIAEAVNLDEISLSNIAAGAQQSTDDILSEAQESTEDISSEIQQSTD